MVNKSLGRARVAFALLLALAVVAPMALGVARDPAREETFFEAVDVDVVSIEVVVTDRDGKPVTGLSQDDFELFEDGRKMAITNFYAEEGGTAAAVAAPAQRGAPRGGPADDQGLYMGVFVDNNSLTARARNHAVAAMKKFLSRDGGPGERILLASYEGGMRIRRGPTNDPAALERVLSEIASGSSNGAAQEAELRSLLRQIDDASLPAAPSGPSDKFTPDVQDASPQEADAVYAALRSYAQRRNDEVRRTLEALGQFVDSMAGLPGRKAVLFVSGGLPMRPSQSLYEAMSRKYAMAPDLNRSNPLEAFTYDATSDMRRVLAKANANRVTFYSLAALDESSAPQMRNTNWTPDLAGTSRLESTMALKQLADATGGFAALDPFDPGPLLARMHSDLTTFYSLGFVSPDRKSGKTHRIEVKVRQPGLTVRHRENYLAKTGGQRAQDRTFAAMLLGETRNPLGVAVDLGEQTRTAKGEVELEVMVRFPLANLVLLPSDHFHEGRVSVFIGSRDGHGRSSRITQIAVPIRIPNEQLLTAMGQSAGYQTKLLLRPEPHQVAVGVRDELGNNDATVLTDFTPTVGGPGKPGSGR